MWVLEECTHYTFIQIKNGPSFCKLENFPTHLSLIYETYYVVFSDEKGKAVLFPYAQRCMRPYASGQDTPQRGLYCSWKDLIHSLKELEKRWEIKGKLILKFTPQSFDIPDCKRFAEISYHLSTYPYGYVASVEQWAVLRKPSDFPLSSDWLYKTSYLTFRSPSLPKRIFFPYAASGKALVNTAEGKRNWELLVEEHCEYLKPRVICQFAQDKWLLNGNFESDFMGVDSFESNKDIVQFLFENTKSRLSKSSFDLGHRL